MLFVLASLLPLLIGPFMLSAMELPVCKVSNARVLRDDELREGELYFAGGKLVPRQEHVNQVIDAKGKIVAPGFIDIQINGGFGIDLSNSPEEVDVVAKQLPKHGVTSFCPTVVSSPTAVYEKAIPLLQARQVPGGAEILGTHLEGPFINPERRGAHQARVLGGCKDGLQTALERYGSLDSVRIVTLAPELPGALELTAGLREKGIVVSAGHSMASLDESDVAIAAGVGLVTHLFNCVTPWHHRQPGLIGAALTRQELYYSLISDGAHLHTDSIKMAWLAHPEGAILVTDAMAALGLEDGSYELAGAVVEVNEGRAYIQGTETLAGATCPMNECVHKFQQATGCAVAQALELASLRPAQLLGIDDRKGRLDVGCDADFIIVDEDLVVHETYIAGQRVGL